MGRDNAWTEDLRGMCLTHSRENTDWVDDMKRWPEIVYADILRIKAGFEIPQGNKFISKIIYKYLHLQYWQTIYIVNTYY